MAEQTTDGRAPTTWRAFVILLSVATVIDNAPYPRMLWDALWDRGSIADPSAWPRTAWVATALWAMLRPQSKRRYLLLCAVGAIVIVAMLPRVPNHFLLELGLFAGSLAVFLAARSPSERFASMRLLAVGCLFAVYFWSFVHKLNTGFLDPTTSCGPVFVDSLSSRLGLPTVGAETRTGTVIAVLVAEGAMPLLLLSARLRGAAVLLGIGLHLLFGLFVPGFSLLMWAMYFLLLPPASLDRFVERLRHFAAPLTSRFRARLDAISPSIVQAVLFFLIIAGALSLKEVPRLRGLEQRETALLPMASLVALFLGIGLASARMRLPLALPGGRSSAIALLFPALLLANGAVPYLGIRNTLAFSMFSNLRTSDRTTNHLFLPSLSTRWSVLDDTVRITASSDPILSAYASPQHRIKWNWTTLIVDGDRASFEIPFFMIRYRAEELRRLSQPMFFVRFENRGVEHELSKEEVGALAPVSRVASWLHWSKGIPLPPFANACMW